jgi:hypothetical protein
MIFIRLSSLRALVETYSICEPCLFTVAQWIEADGIVQRKRATTTCET